MSEEIIYGVNPVKEALRSSRRAFELFVVPSAADNRLEKIVTLAEEQSIPVRRRMKPDLSRLCGTEHHQGIALRVEEFTYADLEDIVSTADIDSVVLVLDGIQDPHNLGALIRSAACAGSAGVIIPKDRAAGISPVVEKTSAGATETVPVARVINITTAIDQLKQNGYWVYGAVGEAGSSLYDHQLSGKIAVVIGGEGDGLRPLVRKQCDVLFKIPMLGGVSSLNASVAGGVILFEVVRQKISKK